MVNKIIFHATKLECGNKYMTKPGRSVSYLPEWYKKSKKYSTFTHSSGKIGKSSTYKNCVPFFDAMSCGYVYQTLTDIHIEIIDDMPVLTYDDKKFSEWINDRPEIHSLDVSDQYYRKFYSWTHPWCMETPKNFSSLIVHPLNRIDLPFYTFSGLIDSDNFVSNGNMPFVIRKGFSGTIPAGTPFAQIIPLKREDWESEIKIYTLSQINERSMHVQSKYNAKNRPNTYRNSDWSRKTYD